MIGLLTFSVAGFTDKEKLTRARSIGIFTLFKNHRKSLIQHCERSELCLHFEWKKVKWKCQKLSFLANFWKSESCGQTVLPDRLRLIEQKCWKIPKVKKSNATLWVIFKQCEYRSLEWQTGFGLSIYFLIHEVFQWHKIERHLLC